MNMSYSIITRIYFFIGIITSFIPFKAVLIFTISHYHSYANISNEQSKFFMSLNVDDEPVSYNQANT